MSTSLRSIFSRQKREQRASDVQDPKDSWSLEKYRKEYKSLSIEMERLREIADNDCQASFAGRQIALNAQHEIENSRRMLLSARNAFKDLERDLANGIDIDRCRRVVNESDVPRYATTEVHNELKRLRATVNGLKSRVKGLAAEIKEHLK
ncbi:uncharacterized protein FTOL_03153 [Fusarium torulosum]|uniref:Uncharacterized protein n=1 Tax=Fusarium torulosum TaxID=33205 RepID=A0AAE8SF17_9HYPO|nr:uncharacterized protein FTOL_03153 [Fusarium torulosum]